MFFSFIFRFEEWQRDLKRFNYVDKNRKKQRHMIQYLLVTLYVQINNNFCVLFYFCFAFFEINNSILAPIGQSTHSWVL